MNQIDLIESNLVDRSKAFKPVDYSILLTCELYGLRENVIKIWESLKNLSFAQATIFVL